MFQEELLKWYDRYARKLIFREKKDAYSIWISEIMAQQTRIEAMIPYYQRFVQTFPDIQSLARAEDDQLTKLWQGLGYYNRVRNMKKCAQVCVEKYHGTLPHSKKELETLPGIGSYTAGAIASIAFDEKVSAIDGNVIRVFSRLYHIEDDVSQGKVKKNIEALVDSTLTDPISKYNQALMELGALVCIPKNPRCDMCPIRSYCQSCALGDASSLPVQAKKKARRVEEKHYYIVVWDQKIHLCQRPEKGLLAGLYEFDEIRPESIQQEIELEPYTHIFSHVEWRMKGTLCFVNQGNENFHSLETIHEKFSIPGAFQPFFRQAEAIIKEENYAGSSD